MTVWKRRARNAAIGIVLVLVAAGGAVSWLWQDRQSIDDFGWPPAPTLDNAAAVVTATWLGVSTILFDDGETQVLLDGFISRPSLVDGLFRRPVASDAAMINRVMHDFDMRRLAAIIPMQSHFDHAMDAGAVANRSSATVLGSASTANIARGAGVPEDQILVAEEDRVYEFGAFSVRLVPTRHAPIGWRGSTPLPGTIDEPLVQPQPVSAWREGGSFSVVIAHPQGTALAQAGAGFIEGALEGIDVDFAFLGIYGLTSLGSDYSEKYWQEMVTLTGAKSVFPVHFDDFTRPFGDIVPAPRVLCDIAETAQWFELFRDRWDQDTRLFRPEFGRPIAIYAQSDSTT